jgi:hypothetical protein
MRVAPRAHARFLIVALLASTLSGAWASACRSDPSAQITAAWTLAPTPPLAGGDVVARVVLRDGAGQPVVGARLHLEGQMSHPGMAPVITDMSERGDGTYEARLRLTMAGDWILVLSGQLRDGIRITRQLELPGVRGTSG